MTDTKIEWVKNSDGTSGQTWNPLAGCTLKSPGCFDEKALFAPLKRKKPTMYFVNSMSDLFHESVPVEQIAQVYNVMAECPQHTFQILTKRSERMRQVMNGPKSHDLWNSKLWHKSVLPNVWLGTSVEDQKRADERIPDLLATPAAVRWLSMEPLLGPVDLREINCSQKPELAGFYWINPLTGENDDMCRPCRDVPSLNWIVVGGESGPGAREFDPEWARQIRDQCSYAGVPFFMKQMGGANKARMPEIPADLMVREYPK